MSRSAAVAIGLALAVTACAPAAGPATQPGGQAAPTLAAMPQRTLVIIVREELPSLAAKPVVAFSGSLDPPKRIFNATLDFIDEKERPQPYLSEALPQLNTDTWRVLPDGRMETTHRLRPNLRWHDGVPLEAEDFVFAWKVYSTPAVGVSSTKPIRQIEEAVAPDARTLLIRWKVPFPEAARMDILFQALPRHMLDESFGAVALGGDAAAFANLPFWTIDYVGLGPYKVEHFEPGTFLDATAFEYHALGRPKIDRLRVRPISDPNTALATMLSGEGHFVGDFIIDYEGGTNLEREWATRGGGTVFFAPVLLRTAQIQQRPEYASPKALLDVRVRRALAHGFDVPGALDVFTGPHGVASYGLTSPRADYYSAIEPVITKRPFNVQMAQRLLEEAGFARGSDGIYASATGERLQVDVWTTGGAVFERENRIFVDSLRQAGVDATPQAIGPARLRDAQYRALLPGFFVSGSGNERLVEYAVDSIPRPENRWQGNNRGGWESAEYQRLWQLFNGTLDQSERIRQIAQMEHLLNEDVGAIPLYYTVVVTGHVGNLKGPVARMTPDAPLGIHYTWLWEWTS